MVAAKHVGSLCIFSWAKLGHCSHSFQCAGEGAEPSMEKNETVRKAPDERDTF